MFLRTKYYVYEDDDETPEEFQETVLAPFMVMLPRVESYGESPDKDEPGTDVNMFSGDNVRIVMPFSMFNAEILRWYLEHGDKKHPLRRPE